MGVVEQSTIQMSVSTVPVHTTPDHLIAPLSFLQSSLPSLPIPSPAWFVLKLGVHGCLRYPISPKFLLKQGQPPYTLQVVRSSHPRVSNLQVWEFI